MRELIAAVDQGTTSTRCMLFDAGGRLVASEQREHRQILPKPGWVEHDPLEIWESTCAVVRGALANSKRSASEIAAVGITNQRETLVVWDPSDGRPLCNAIVWQDARTKELCDELAREGGIDRFRARTGLPIATYFTGTKLAWVLRNVDGVRAAAERGRAMCGTIDSWLVWKLTGGAAGGRHVTDVTNASRTMLMDLARLEWDDEQLAAFGVPRSMLPRIEPSSDASAFGTTRADGPFGAEVPIAGALGDQHAAMLGQCCFEAGEAKNTYGTGCFLLLHTGDAPVPSKSGLVTTLAYQLGGRPAQYALEGSVAYAGSLVQWLRDELGMIGSAAEVETLARSVEDDGGVVLVPAFSGLFAPHWRSDARGVLVGLTRFVNRGHIARAVLEAVCFQSREVLDAMRADSGVALSELRVDGGMTKNALLMQTQADLLGSPVVRPAFVETTALGAAYAAGLAVGLFPDLEALRGAWKVEQRFEPAIDEDERERRLARWRKAVERSLGWVE